MLGFFMLAEPDANQSEALNLIASDLSYLFVGTDKASENRKRITMLFPFFIIHGVSEQPSNNCLKENKTNKAPKQWRVPFLNNSKYNCPVFSRNYRSSWSWLLNSLPGQYCLPAAPLSLLPGWCCLPVSHLSRFWDWKVSHCCPISPPCGDENVAACSQKCRNDFISSEECIHLCNELFLDVLQSIS